jgi:hypothetical protein
MADELRGRRIAFLAAEGVEPESSFGSRTTLAGSRGVA